MCLGKWDSYQIELGEMELLVALRSGDPLVFLPAYWDTFEKDRTFALRTLTYLRSPDNLINTYSKKICRLILFQMSIRFPVTYKKYIVEYFKKTCWVDALHIYRLRILWCQEYHKDAKDAKLPNPELTLLSQAILSGDTFAAKWAPSEKSMWNQEPLFAADLVAKECNLSMRDYRLRLSDLRRDVLEVQLSEGRYEDIVVGDIPKTAFHQKKDALSRNSHDLRTEILSYVPPEGMCPYFFGICVLDNSVLSEDAYEFVAWVSRNCYLEHFRRKVLNMGEFVGMVGISESGSIGSALGGMLFGAGVLRLDTVYEFLLGQILIHRLSEIPKIVFVVGDVPLRRVPDLSNIRKLYGNHGREVPDTIYINFGRSRRVPKVVDSNIVEVCGISEVSLGIAYIDLSRKIVDTWDIGESMTKDPNDDYLSVSRIFFW